MTQDYWYMPTFEEYPCRNGETPHRHRPAGFLQALEGHGGHGWSKGVKRTVHHGRGCHATTDKVRIRKRYGGVLPNPPEQEIAYI